MASIASTAQGSKKLILHFDINKTIIMKDTAKGQTSTILTICKILALSAWGRKVQKQDAEGKEETVWQVDLEELHYESYPGEEESKDPLTNYYEFLKETHLPKTEEEVPDEEERTKLNEQIEN